MPIAIHFVLGVFFWKNKYRVQSSTEEYKNG